MEVIKPVDFSSFTAFCEHLNSNSTTAKAIAAAAATSATSSVTTTVTPPSPPSPSPPTETTTSISSSSSSTTTATIKTTIPTPTTTAVTATQQTQINGNIYVEKMERQGKMEMAAKERESQRLQCIPKKWNRREEYEFLRVLTGYGVDMQPPSAMMGGSNALTPDWTKFKQMAHLERKSDETLSDYYKVFIAMCKRQAGVKLNESERGLEGIIEDISEDHAKLILDRLELLSKLREIARHPQLEKRLKLCMKNTDTPDWWEPGRHDKELIAAVLKHGLYRSETFIFNDQSFSFAESEKRFIRELEAQIQRTIKLEAFNAEKAPSVTINQAESVKNEVIDLDDELLTKNSLIKKENYVGVVKEEPKVEIVTETTKNNADSDQEKVDASSVNDEIKAEDLATNGEKETTTEKVEKLSDEEVSEKQDEELQNNKTKEVSTEEESEAIKQTTDEKMETDEDSKVDEAKPEDISDELNEVTPATGVEKESTEKESIEVEETEKQHKETTNETETNQPIETEVAATVDEDDETKKSTTEVTEKTEAIPESMAVEKGEKTDESASEEVKEGETEVAKKQDVPESTAEQETPESLVKSGEVNTTAKQEKQSKVSEETVIDLVTDVNTTSTADPDDEEVMKEKEKAVEEECKKQAAELKARFPDLEVIQPATVKQKLEKPKLEMCMIRWFKDFALERRIAHIVTCVETNKWPVDCNYSAFAGCKGIDLNIGLHEAIPHLNAIERRSTTPDVITITTDQGVTKHLPASQMQQVAGVAGNASATSSVGKGGVVALDANSINAAVAAAVAAAAGAPSSALPSLIPGMSMTAANTSTGMSSGTATPVNVNSGSTATTPTASGKKRKRHIAIDVETERAKLHALLNSSQGMGPKDWETEIANMEALTAGPVGRRSANAAMSPASAAGSASSLGNLQPPPAHQHALSRQNSGQFNKPSLPPLKTPPPSMGAPMDLSSSLPKMNMSDMLKSASNVGAIDLSEVQDFSMSSKKSSNVHAALNSAFSSLGSGKSKLDDTLNKLMKKNNCTIEEPVIGKEKKRKKLDEIVLGLSAAKEQKTFPDPSLPSSKKPQIPPSVSVTPANVPSSMSSQNQSNQKPFTITVTTVPGKSKTTSSSSNMPSTSSSVSSGSGLSGLQNMNMGGLSSKDSLNALLAQTMATDPQTFLKQQQKMIQCLPPAQRKVYESMLAEMEQAMKMTNKYSPHDVKVNKWLSDMSTPLSDQLTMEYAPSSSSNASGRRSNRQNNASQQQQQSSQMSKAASQAPQLHQQQSAAVGPQGLTGEEPVPVINKQTGKRLTGNKAPQLKRLMSWLTENPQYEVDPKWLEQMQNPMPAPSPKPTSMDTSYGTSNKSHGGRPSSNSSNASSSGGSHSQMQVQSSSSQSSASAASSASKKSARQTAIDQANAAMQFGSLAGLNPNLLASLPGLGAFDPKNALAGFDPKNSLAGFDPKNPLAGFDPKNPLLSMPFAGMPGMGNIPGLGNLNNMNLFASLAGMGGLGNLAGMDAQSLAALMAAAGPALTGLGGASGSGNSGASSSSKSSMQQNTSSNKKNKNNDTAAQLAAANAAVMASAAGGSGSGSSSSSSNKNAASAAQLAAGLPFLFPNPSLLYPPMGLSGLNPYSLGSTGLGSAYDQLAQQYNLLNGGVTVSSASNSSTTQSKSHQSQSKSGNSRSSNSSASMANAAAAAAASAASLMSAMANMSGGHGMGVGGSSNQSSSQSSSRGGGRQSAAASRAQQAQAEMAQLSNLLMPGADPHLLESLTRMAGMDLAQATRLMNSLGMQPVSSGSSSSDKRSSSSASASAAAAAAAQAAQEKQAAKEQQKWMESLARGVLPSDLSALQAFSQGKLPASLTGASTSGSSNTQSGSSSSSSKNAAKAAAAAAAAQLPQIPGMPADFSQAFLEMAGLPLMGPGALNSLAQLTGPTGGSSSSSSSAKRQREQDALAKDAFKQQMDYYTKTLGLGSGISLIPTSMAGGTSSGSSSAAYSGLDEQHKSKRARMDAHASQLASLKADEMTAVALAAAGLPLNLGGGMTSIEKSLRSSSSAASAAAIMHPPSSSASSSSEADKVTLTPLNSAGIAANLPSQTTITIAPPISSGASSSSDRSERSESRISLTITNAADAAKLPPPYEEADELIIQPILKKSTTTGCSSNGSAGPTTSQASATTTGASSALNISGSNQGDELDGAGNTAASCSGSTTASNASAVAAAATSDNENRRHSSRLKRPRSGADHSLIAEHLPEKRRELRSTRHTRQSSGGNNEASLNLSTSEGDDKPE